MQITVKQAFDRAFSHERSGRKAAALAIYAEILAAIPNHPGALLRLAVHDLEADALESARSRLRAALDGAVAQGLPLEDIWFAYARLHLKDGDRVAARQACQRTLDLVPEALAPLQLLAWLLLDAGDPNGARVLCQRALARHPRDKESLHLLGRSLKAMGDSAAARRVLVDCVTIAGEDPEVLTTLGAVCIDTGDPVAASEHLERAIASGASSAEVWDNLGVAYSARGDHGRALHAFEQAVAANPGLTPALANLVHARRSLCEWDGIDAWEQRLVATLDTPGSDPRWSPHIALNCGLTPAQELAVARRWSRAMFPAPAAPRPAHPRGSRLRVGYLSSDFREHPTGRLMAGLFEECDRNRFEIFAYSYGSDDGSELSRRIRAAFGSAWRDVRNLSDAEAASVIRDDRIDVLVERKGHTRGTRLGILASRPAPVQVHYMSFPGTLGYDAVDGLIADDVVVPEGDEIHYHERIWRMPRCYFVNDRRRGLPAPSTRAEAGLPEKAVVLASLNQSYKLSPTMFAAWMEALRCVPRAVLWLLAVDARTRVNLHAHAARAGVDPARLIFAPPMPQEAHIARLRCADLALDTRPVGSHTTACDALWAGVPMLTWPGRTFASRVGASVLRAAGLPELIATSLSEYQARLVELASAPDTLHDHRAFLERERGQNPLFDTAGFARDWESLLERIYEGTLVAR